MEELLKYTKALVGLQVAAIARSDGTPPKVELILNRAGFSHAEVAELLGKTPNAVKMAVRDAKGRRPRATKERT